MKILQIIFIVSILIGCAATEKDIPYYNREPVNKIEMQKLPQWLYETPSGDCVVGISNKTFDETTMQESARQMAAVIESRNRGSYAIDKFAVRNSEDIMREGKVKFKLNVSSSPREIESISNSLKLIDEVYFFDYFIGLFSPENLNLPDRGKSEFIANFPDWFSENKISAENGNLASYASGSSYDLISAWEKAADEARLNLAKYLEKNVLGAVENRNEMIDKKISLETAKKIEKMKITRSYIVSEMRDSQLSYKVYLEMKMKE